jgi:hypothetical protein
MEPTEVQSLVEWMRAESRKWGTIARVNHDKKAYARAKYARGWSEAMYSASNALAGKLKERGVTDAP